MTLTKILKQFFLDQSKKKISQDYLDFNNTFIDPNILLVVSKYSPLEILNVSEKYKKWVSFIKLTFYRYKSKRLFYIWISKKLSIMISNEKNFIWCFSRVLKLWLNKQAFTHFTIFSVKFSGIKHILMPCTSHHHP